MTTGYLIKDQSEVYFVTLQIVEWVDVFSRIDYRDIVIENIRFCQNNKGLIVYAYVIMSNHIHMILQAENDNLSNILRDLKSYTSKCILNQIQNSEESRKCWMLDVFRMTSWKHSRNSHYQVFTHENHSIHLYSDKFIDQKLEYIHNNPVKAGIVKEPEHYIYSSASNYACEESILDVEIISTTWKTY